MQYFIRNKLIFAFFFFFLGLAGLFFKNKASVIFILGVIFIIISVLWVFLYTQTSKYIDQMKSGKVPVKILKGTIIKITPLRADPTNETTIRRKYIWSRYFEVKTTSVSIVYKSDILEYKGKWIFTIKDFINYTNKFLKVGDKINVYISKDKPKYYYLEDIIENKQNNIKK